MLELTRLHSSIDGLTWRLFGPNPVTFSVLERLRGQVLAGTGYREFLDMVEREFGSVPVTIEGVSADLVSAWRIRQFGEDMTRTAIEALDVVPGKECKLFGDQVEAPSRQAAAIIIRQLVEQRRRHPVPEDWFSTPAAAAPSI